MKETIIFLLFNLLWLCYITINHCLRIILGRCLMFGEAAPVAAGKTLKLKILWRAKSRGAQAIQELASLDNFILYFDRYVDNIAAELRNTEVSLYGFTQEFAYFSVVSPGQDVWTGVFSSPVQFNKARYLLLVPQNKLREILGEAPLTRDKTIYFLHHTNRCGSTLIAAMFKRLSSTRVICEPESLYSAYYLYHVKKTITKEHYSQMVELAVGTHCLTHHHTICFKTVSGVGTSQINILSQFFPNSKTVFLSRNCGDVVKSMMRIVESGHPLMVRALGRSWESFANLCLWARSKQNIPREFPAVLLLHWELCMTAVARAAIPIKSLTYEDLVADPLNTVRSLLEFLEMPTEHAEDMIVAMEQDYQEGTRISRAVLKPHFKDPSKASNQLVSKNFRG